MKITFPYWGNYTVAFKTLLEKLGLCVVLPEKTNPRSIEEGAKFSPEMYCFPLKTNVGNFLSAIRKGADTVFMVTSLGGSCRLRYYGEIEKKVLKEAGYDVKFIVFDQAPLDIYRKIKEISRASFWQIIKAILFFYKKLRFIEELEKKANYLRPREIKKGETDEILRQAFLNLEKINTEKEFRKFERKILKKISEIKIDEKKDIPKVGIVGEIYTVTDGAINFGVEEKLGREDIEVHREMDLTYHIKKKIFPWKDWLIQRKINPYLKSTVGGHGRDAIYEMLNHVKKDFDGVIQLLPFGCFVKDTNITVENYIQKPIQDIKVGEKVLTHKGRFKKITHKFCRNYQGPILKIDCGGKLLTISVTPEHPLLLAKTFVKNQKKEIEKFDFIPAIEAKKGDFIAIPIPLENRVEDPVSIDYSAVRTEPNSFMARKEINKFTFKPDLLKLLGYYLAEGTIFWKRKENIKIRPCGVGFCFNINEKNYINDVIQIISTNFDLNAKVKTNFSPNSAVVTVYNKNLADFMKYLCGFMRDKKRLSHELLNLEPSLHKEILKGFFRGDGCFTDEYGETTYRGVTTSQDLASQLFWLLIRNRIKSSLMEQNIKNRKVSYALKISNAQGIKRLGDELIRPTERKNNIRFRELENYFLVPIRKIKLVSFNGKVYNLTVKDDHSYIANFLVAKNCMPESTIRPILQKIHLETGIPFLSLSLDEQVAEAGINTRIEAFVDVVKNYHNRKKKI